MNNFEYVRPATISDAVTAATRPGAAYLASGTNLLDLMKGGIACPSRLVDITRLPGLDRVERLADGGLRIGTLVRNADLAHDPDFATCYPAIAEAHKTRPAGLADTGYGEADKRRRQNTDFFHLFRTKEEVGQRVLQGILNDELYIMTHSEFRQGVEERAQAMCAAVPDLPQNDEYKRTFSFLFRNPIHAAETARQQQRGKT